MTIFRVWEQKYPRKIAGTKPAEFEANLVDRGTITAFDAADAMKTAKKRGMADYPVVQEIKEI